MVWEMLFLQDNAAAWERWVYMFAQMRQLPAMAPHIPIEHPTLRQTAYEMMLHAFLLNRADHSILLALVKDWPTHLYSVTTLTEAVLHRSVVCWRHFGQHDGLWQNVLLLTCFRLGLWCMCPCFWCVCLHPSLHCPAVLLEYCLDWCPACCAMLKRAVKPCIDTHQSLAFRKEGADRAR